MIPKLPEPLTIAKFWKSRRRDQAVHVALREYEGHILCDSRIFFVDPDGKMQPAVDFLSMVDTPYVWELNIWYHTLNAGYRTRVSGETDFPCIYGERVGLGRSYVKLDGKLDYDAWCEGIRNGRNYVSDGFSHLMDLKVGDVKVGENGSESAA